MVDGTPIPVAVAQAIAEKYGKACVVVFALDRDYGHVQRATFGVEAHDKTFIARLAEVCERAMGLDPGQGTLHEDFRTQLGGPNCAANLKEAIDLLRLCLAHKGAPAVTLRGIERFIERATAGGTGGAAGEGRA